VILAEERDALKLAKMAHPKVKVSTEQIVKALECLFQLYVEEPADRVGDLGIVAL
jgi:hypothetical protein